MAELAAAPAVTTNNDESDKTNNLTLKHDGGGEGERNMNSQGEGADSGKREPEEALETHELIELNKFTTKRKWIEEKIQLLESMPPIEVFAGVEALLSLSEEMPPGLSTRAELDRWLEEHDRIEKETEIFDAEDMSKLKQLTKAATQRNLSPEDTDLIELTLTTLLALDKLLHLLRDRSETLDLLGLRLAWEEQRVAAWRERRSLLDDLRTFLTSRARWSLDTYELPPPSTPSSSPALRYSSPSPSPRPSPAPSKRRDSAASLASMSSDTSTSTTGPSSVFSRSTRYRLSELLSHDAALFSSRLTALNHGKVTPAGKTLDRLIDASRKPVPDEILDEQDRLEDKGIKEIETIGKFAMAVVMQWKRADEHYSDTKKDQAAAQALITELNNAMLQHPTARHDAAFMSRAQALTKRLAVKGDPALPRSSFPRPMHLLFPDQGASNEVIVKTLSTELAEAVTLARQAEAAALSYRAGLEAVKQAEALRERMRTFDEQLGKIIGKLAKGVHEERGHGDGSPPDLGKESCLDPMRHATFLALLPSILQELEQTDKGADRALREGRVALLRIKELPGVDPQLQQDVVSTMEVLEARRNEARRAKEDVMARAQRLKEARRLWGILSDITATAEEARKLAVDDMERNKWRVQERRSDALLTPDPESPEPNRAGLPVTLTPDALLQRLDALEQRLSNEFNSPLALLAPTLEKPLHSYLKSNSDGLSKSIDEIRGVARLWDRILRQSREMSAVQRDAKELEGKVGLLQANIDFGRQDVLDTNRAPGEITALEADFRSQASALRDSVWTFTDSLVTRIPLVSRADGVHASDTRTNPSPNSNSILTNSSSAQRLDDPKELLARTLPFHLSTLDNGVRADANTLALRLAGGMKLIDKKLDYLCLSRLAKIVDTALQGLVEDVKNSERALSDMKTSFESIEQTSKSSGLDLSRSESLAAAREQLDRIAQDHHARVARSAAPVRQTVEALQAATGAHDSPVHATVVAPRVKAANDASGRVDMVNENFSQLKARIVEAEREEGERLRIEREQLEEKARLEKERQDAEEKRRQEAEERAKLERERLEAEEKERLDEVRRLERKRLEAEENARLEQQRIEEERKKNDREHEEKLAAEDRQRKLAAQKPRTPDEDVFGLRLAPSISSKPPAQEVVDLRTRILSLRNRLRSLNLGNLARPSPKAQNAHAAAALPTSRETSETQAKFVSVVSDAAALPASTAEDLAINSELKSLRFELDAANALVQRLVQLGTFTNKVAACDHALSDMLEHADSYPAAPSPRHLASSHVSDTRLPCEEQMASRLTFTKHVMDEMTEVGSILADDMRVTEEQKRIEQTWSELVDMCTDRINGARSRPTSSVSSTGRNSVNTTASGSSTQRKAKPTLNGHGHPRVRPSGSSSRRAVSGAHDPISRPSTHMSNRSVSGPSGLSSLFNTTFASRQRTTSLASIQSASMAPVKRPMSPVTRPHTTSKRPGSPTFSETSSHSFASTPSRSTWSRVPRQSFGTMPKDFQVSERAHKRKAYVANPKSKLDVAVGHVVNNFKVPVTIQAASDGGWKDQSGKYWIGDAEPKLCFCRILRSQTVMVRVGGGWCELSKFLRGHFADLLAELPPSPPRKEERWISSATLLEAPETPISSGTRSPATPEPKGTGLLPSLQLSTPNGTSPQSLKTSSSPGGSPGLTPFQFMRRADPGVRSATPSPSKSTRLKPTTPAATPSRTNIWRP